MKSSSQDERGIQMLIILEGEVLAPDEITIDEICISLVGTKQEDRCQLITDYLVEKLIGEGV